ncbi:MAG TPA: choice-of-anchor Q domain-containing protein [Rubrobacteraceae bacterium]|nr:choice-of-anchor Q domain-containing protein [Rubrobacteraceae bacterium]
MNTQPGLDPLGDYGGLTLTHRPQQDSPAVDAANPACPPPATDQRGEPRPQEGDSDGTGRCDIGSFELGPPEDERGCDIRGTRGDDPLVGTAADEVICGLGGDDTIIGGGEDELRGNNGEDRLDSRAGVRGNDTIKGGEGRDRCRADKRDERRSC